MRRVSLIAALLLVAAVPANAHDPCLSLRAVLGNAQAQRALEAKQRDDFAAKLSPVPGPPDRDAQLASEIAAKAAQAATCAAAERGQ